MSTPKIDMESVIASVSELRNRFGDDAVDATFRISAARKVLVDDTEGGAKSICLLVESLRIPSERVAFMREMSDCLLDSANRIREIVDRCAIQVQRDCGWPPPPALGMAEVQFDELLRMMRRECGKP